MKDAIEPGQESPSGSASRPASVAGLEHTASSESPLSTHELVVTGADRDALLEELTALRRAHEALSRRLIVERAAFADGLARVQANLYSTRSWRYTAPLRGGIRLLRRLKP
jgi:hypothetical protein